MRCAYCHDEIQTTAGVCAGCQTGLHPECWSEAQRCPTLGCTHVPVQPLGWLGKLVTGILLSIGGAIWVSVGEAAIPRTSFGLHCFVQVPEPPPILDPPNWRRGPKPIEFGVTPYRPDPPALPPQPAQRRIQRGPRRRLAT